MECEICGARASRKSKIEGVVMDVCERCAELGEEIKLPRAQAPPKVKLPNELEIVIKSDLGNIIKKEREKKGLTQEQLAKKLMLRTSVLARIEGGWEPPLAIVESLEKFFKIKLKEKVETKKSKASAGVGSVTIGDIVEIKNAKH